MRELVFDHVGSMVRWYELPGRLPARLFVHGLGGSGAGVFGGVAGHPSLNGHRTLVLDLPGHGMSDRPADWDYTLDDHAAVVARVCEAAGLDTIDLVGHSLGADIAVVAAGRNPGLVGRLVVAEANLDPLPPSPTGLFSQKISAQSEEEFVARGYQALLEDVPTWRPLLRLCDARAVYRSAVGLTTGTSPTMRELLVATAIPRTFIRGEHGEELRDPDGLRAAGVRLVVIPSAGHMMMRDAPDAFVEALATELGAGA